MKAVAIIGTLDTKGEEFAFLRDRVAEHGLQPLVIDVGVLGEPRFSPDVSHDRVAELAGTSIADLRSSNDRGQALTAMATGAAMLTRELHESGRLDAMIGMGGSGNASVAAAAMQALPTGVPKLLVTTVASGDTRAYVGTTDVTLMPSVVDIAGLNRFSIRILSNAAAAISGMAAQEPPKPPEGTRPLVAATMFGVTTPSVTAARQRLEELGYEVLVFHATGTGGRAMEALARDGYVTGVLDITTTELADELVGGVFGAGPDRLEAAGTLGLPQVVSLGALDMVNFGPMDTVPAKFRGRKLYVHNPTITLMRTTPEENAQLGEQIARKLNAARGPLAVFVPRRGVSAIDVEGGAFFDPAADAALFGALKRLLRPDIRLIEMDTDINDPSFARAMADTFNDLYRRWEASRSANEAPE
ncbi:MAG: hypothetical protein JWO59_2800 [Chloroflexi bacterium]|nr:hypothetical protein [Chloroflexota bacterium]